MLLGGSMVAFAGAGAAGALAAGLAAGFGAWVSGSLSPHATRNAAASASVKTRRAGPSARPARRTVEVGGVLWGRFIGLSVEASRSVAGHFACR